MFCTVCRVDRVSLRVRVWLWSEDEGETEVQVSGEHGETLMVSVSCQVQEPYLLITRPITVN